MTLHEESNFSLGVHQKPRLLVIYRAIKCNTTATESTISHPFGRTDGWVMYDIDV